MKLGAPIRFNRRRRRVKRIRRRRRRGVIIQNTLPVTAEAEFGYIEKLIETYFLIYLLMASDHFNCCIVPYLEFSRKYCKCFYIII